MLNELESEQVSYTNLLCFSLKPFLCSNNQASKQHLYRHLLSDISEGDRQQWTSYNLSALSDWTNDSHEEACYFVNGVNLDLFSVEFSNSNPNFALARLVVARDASFKPYAGLVRSPSLIYEYLDVYPNAYEQVFMPSFSILHEGECLSRNSKLMYFGVGSTDDDCLVQSVTAVGSFMNGYVTQGVFPTASNCFHGLQSGVRKNQRVFITPKLPYFEVSTLKGSECGGKGVASGVFTNPHFKSLMRFLNVTLVEVSVTQLSPHSSGSSSRPSPRMSSTPSQTTKDLEQQVLRKLSPYSSVSERGFSWRETSLPPFKLTDDKREVMVALMDLMDFRLTNLCTAIRIGGTKAVRSDGEEMRVLVSSLLKHMEADCLVMNLEYSLDLLFYSTCPISSDDVLQLMQLAGFHPTAEDVHISSSGSVAHRMLMDAALSHVRRLPFKGGGQRKRGEKGKKKRKRDEGKESKEEVKVKRDFSEFDSYVVEGDFAGTYSITKSLQLEKSFHLHFRDLVVGHGVEEEDEEKVEISEISAFLTSDVRGLMDEESGKVDTTSTIPSSMGRSEYFTSNPTGVSDLVTSSPPPPSQDDLREEIKGLVTRMDTVEEHLQYVTDRLDRLLEYAGAQDETPPQEEEMEES